MNWQLIRSSPTWRIAAWASPVYALGWLILSQGNRSGVTASAPLLVWLGHVLMASREPQIAFRCTFFEAALPIPGRQLWVSKKIVGLGLIWLPVLAASAVGFAVLRDPALPLLEATAGYTVILLFATGFDIRQFYEPHWICFTSLIAGGAAMIAIARALPNSGGWVLAAYFLASAALFVLTWRRVPNCFQVTGTELVATKRVSAKTFSQRPLWWRILQPVYGWQLAMLALGGLVWWAGGVTALVVYFGAGAVSIAGKVRWRFLAHLPVSGRVFFAAMWAPYALLTLASSAVSLRFRGTVPFVMRDPRNFTTTLALSVILLLGLAFTFQANDWRRMRRWPKALRWIAASAVPVAIGLAWPAEGAWHRYGDDPVPYFALQLAGMLPANPWLLPATLLIPLAGLYWLAERSFCEMEYLTLTQTSETEPRPSGSGWTE